ncbi:MAG: hypothetical protein ACOX02_01915 [Acholeplasmatales bacterium]
MRLKRVFVVLIVFFLSILSISKIRANNLIYDNISAQAIAENIDVFNEEIEGIKPKTYFTSVEYIVPVYDFQKEEIGTLLIFNDNSGYFMFDKENYVLAYDYSDGIPLSNAEFSNGVVYFNKMFYPYKEAIFNKSKYYPDIDLENQIKGFIVDDIFHFHCSPDFNKKRRELLNDFDPQYATLTYTVGTNWKNKVTQSSNQEENDCGPLALANLLWTYKINGGPDLTNGATSSENLAVSLYSSLGYTVGHPLWPQRVTDLNNYLAGTGYKIRSIDVSNGISDDLAIAPIVGLYSSAKVVSTAHYALVTGKGKSLYKKILGISFWTSWDIINTWYDMNYTINGYIARKYWVDNKYIWYGWALAYTNTNNIVPL